MDHQLAIKRSQRLQKIASDLGVVLDADLTPLSPPPRPPSFLQQDDERKADAILGQLKIEEAAGKSQAKSLKRFSVQKASKPSNYTYDELYAALSRVIEENGVAGVLEVLLRRFQNVQGNINLARRASTGVIKRIRNADNPEERGRLLQNATQNRRLEFVQLLAPLADQASLDDSLRTALENRNLNIIQTLLQYGANTALYEGTFVNVAQHGDVGLLEILLRATRKVSSDCISKSLLPAVTSGSLPAVLLLVQVGANGDYDGASALMHAVGIDRVDITIAVMLGQQRPSGLSLDRALDSVFSVPSATLHARYPLIEVLLCGGPIGNAANDALLKTTLLGNKDIMDLLLAHRVDINHNGAAAVGHAIQRNKAELVTTLLQDQTLKPELASELVGHIPKIAPPNDKVAVLSKLLVNGASGTHCSELLIAAAEQNDLDTAHLLVSYGRDAQKSLPVCSVDYNASRCLQVAVARNNLPMVKLLALEGGPSKFSLSKAFEAIPPRMSKNDHFLLIQTLLRARAEGPEVDAALHSAVTGQHKSIRLIDLFVQSGTKVMDETLLAAVAQGSPEVLKVLLSGNVSPLTCAAAIPVAMKIPHPPKRLSTIWALIGRATTTGSEVPEVSQAVVDVLQNCPEDKPLLKLLCREGKANINFDGGIVVCQAAKQGDPEVLDIVLNGGGSLPSANTVERALKCATDLQPSDLSRQRKINALLRQVKPQDGMNAALIKEIKSVSLATENLSVIQTLLAAGADVNANEGAKEGAPVCWAVTRNIPALLDLILSKRPSSRSVSLAFPLAFTFQDPARYDLCEKLLRAGAVGEVVSTALYKVAKEGPAALPLMKLLLPHADVNFKDGLALRVVVRHPFFEGLDLLLTPRAVIPSSATRTAAFQEAMKLKGPKDRSQMVDRLLKAGVGGQAMAEALITAVNSADLQLSEVLLKAGASIEYKGGHAVRIAASCGENEILKILVGGTIVAKPTLSTLTSGFGGVLTLKEKDRRSYHRIMQTLLEAGMRGDAVDAALVNAVKEGDSNLTFAKLLFESGASVEWHEGEAINIAAQSAFIESLDLLLEKQVSENVLKRAYRSSSELPKEQRFQVIERLLKAGKAVDKHVSSTLTAATMENPSDRRLITLLLSHEVFDDGQSIVHAARELDLRTLTLLINSPKANLCLSTAFKEAMATDVLWKSSTGLAIVKLMLKKGAVGDAVGEALYQAVEKCGTGGEGLAGEFMDVLLESGADVNYQRGLALQRAAMQVDILLLEKLLPGATSESKAMAIPYLFTCCDDKATVLKAIQAFERSFLEGDPGVDIAFEHPDTNLEPMLFMALDKFPRDTQILKALLDMGFHANQWQICEDDVDIGREPWPVLLWALERPEKKISSANIEMLIEEGANVNFKSKSGMTPLVLAIQNQRSDIVQKLVSRGASVSVPDPDEISPLALASRLGSTPIMELLLRGNAESDDGSLHDAARELRCDAMRVLIKYGHEVDYPSDRHEGRSALAELCLKAVNCRPQPSKIEEAIQCLVANDADIRLRTRSEHDSGKTVLHFALDSSDPMSILPVLLKMTWKILNEECFLYTDNTYTYSLTKYVEKGVYQGPTEQKNDIIRLLRNKRALDRYWGNSIELPQPADYCHAPKYIEEEILRQKLREMQRIEERQDVMNRLELKRITVVGETEIMEIQTEAEMKRDRTKAQVERELIAAKERIKMQLEMDAGRTRDQIMAAQHNRELNHQMALGNVQVRTQRELGDVQAGTQRTIRQEAFEEERTRNVMQIEYTEKKTNMENEALRARLAIEGSAMEDQDRILTRQNEREIARIKMQKTLVDKNLSLAGTLQGAGMNQRQIGYITGEVNSP